MLKRSAAIALGLTLLAPNTIFAATAATPATPATPAAPAAAPAVQSEDLGLELTKQFLMADAWFQNSGEAKALYYQGYNLASLMLDKDLADKTVTKKRAVIVDVDETVLDNSPNNVRMMMEGKEFNPDSWNEWVGLAQAKALPGAVEFLNKADQNGVDVYYVSNRTVDQIPATIKNLQAAGFPQAVESHLLFKDDVSSKEPRRQQIEQDHHIVLLVGDNLVDFAQVFETKNQADRNKAVDELKEKFGQSFIILPNPMYGDWETALYGEQKLTQEQKLQAREAALTSYESAKK